MNLKVEEANWRVNKHKGPPRQQSAAKQVEIRTQCEHMLAHGVVQKSQAEYYSQVHLTPKPNNKWRFCIDYRNLNKVSEGMGWPIPNISQMLQRLGQQRPKLFAKLDLTSGYHQAPLAVDSRLYTAFITFMGIFEWTRVPMGLKGAPSYFQQMMATTVLVGLIYVICEIYLDDIIIYANTEAEFLSRLEEVLKRLQKHNLTLNPDKVELGMPEVEFVGHVINDKGLTFTRERIDKVLEIETPIFGKQLKSFLGVAVYFKDHIDHYSDITKPLHKMIEGYNKAKNKRLTWSEEAKLAFNDLRQAINNLPMLFFLDDQSPIFLRTDASDYGIGAYLCQVVDGKEYPIGFMSKTLTGGEQKWSTIQKECYAIVFAFKKFEYILRDRKFTLQTDHQNLTYLNAETDPKVQRWKLAIQEYDCWVEHIAGKDNIVADGMSRLLPMTEEEMYLRYEFSLPMEAQESIAKVHNEIAGHGGVERTLICLDKQNKHWKYMREHVKQFIRQCPFCQKMNYLKVPIHTHPFTTASYSVMERLGIDTIGPLPESENGMKYILVIIDAFTRWVELYALRDTTAEEERDVLIQHYGRFGCPSQVITDNGSQFLNRVLEEVTKLVGYEHVTTLAYSKEENALVERANKEVLRHLRAFLYEQNVITHWWRHLPLAQRIINASKVSSTGVTPAQLLIPAVNLDRGIFLPFTVENDEQIRLSNWAADMLRTQKSLVDAAEKAQRKKDSEHLANADPRRTEYAVGSYVLLEYPSNIMRRGPPNKFLTQLKGPYSVIRKDRDTYTLLNLVTRREEDVHVTRIHPFEFDATRTDPIEVARRDVVSTFTVERILDHAGDPKRRRSMDFLVKWEGYADEENLWLPYSELRDNPALHEYLRNSNDGHLQALIPHRHRK